MTPKGHWKESIYARQAVFQGPWKWLWHPFSWIKCAQLLRKQKRKWAAKSGCTLMTKGVCMWGEAKSVASGRPEGSYWGGGRFMRVSPSKTGISCYHRMCRGGSKTQIPNLRRCQTLPLCLHGNPGGRIKTPPVLDSVHSKTYLRKDWSFELPQMSTERT